MGSTVPIGSTPVLQVLRRAIALRCPRCGRSPLFASWARMHATCSACGMRFEREQGYFVGAIYVNYALTIAVSLGGVLVLDALFTLPLGVQLVIGVTSALLIPLVGFRHARSLWLALDHLASEVDVRLERRRR